MNDAKDWQRLNTRLKWKIPNETNKRQSNRIVAGNVEQQDECEEGERKMEDKLPLLQVSQERMYAARTIIGDKYIRYRKYLTKGETEKELER